VREGERERGETGHGENRERQESGRREEE